MICPNCGSITGKNGRDAKGRQKWRCKNVHCTKRDHIEHTPLEAPQQTAPQPVTHKAGISIDEFRRRHDISYIVETTLRKLSNKELLTKGDVIKLTGLRQGYPGLSVEIMSHPEYFGKADGEVYFSHPDIIKMLKLEGSMT
jgi:hypothetical protein